MRNSRCEVNEHTITDDMDILAAHDAQLLQRDGVLGVGDASDEVWCQLIKRVSAVKEIRGWDEG